MSSSSSSQQSDKPKAVIVRLIVVGAERVGKTSLVNRYVSGEYSSEYLPTIGIDYQLKTLDFDEKEVRVQIWDTAGAPRFQTISDNYYQRTHGMVLVFDPNNSSSLGYLEKVIESITSARSSSDPDPRFLLLASKGDEPMTSHTALEIVKAETFSYRLGCDFEQVSSRTGQAHIKTVFDRFILRVAQGIKPSEQDGKFSESARGTLPPVREVSISMSKLSQMTPSLNLMICNVEDDIKSVNADLAKSSVSSERELLLKRILQLGKKEAEYRSVWLKITHINIDRLSEASNKDESDDEDD